MKKFLFSTLRLLLLMVVASSDAFAYQPDSLVATLKRPVTGFYNIEIGNRKNLATYLSPFSYQGSNLAVSGLWTKSLPVNPEHLSMTFQGRANLGNLLNPARSAREYDIHGLFIWGMEWKKRLPANFIVGAGGTVGAYGGMMYLPRNGNNPVAAQFATGLGISGSAGWHTSFKGLPVLFTDRLDIPLIGGFFSPQYGETYYEIYLGNHSGLAHFGWPGNRFGIENLLSVTLDFGRTAMQLGYRISYQEEYVNNLITRSFTNSFVIGIVPGGIGLKDKKDIITPLY